MKNRLFLCLLICAFLLYYGLPSLSLQAGGLQGLFSVCWLTFALMVISGNLVGILYEPKQVKQSPSNYWRERRKTIKTRQYQ